MFWSVFIQYDNMLDLCLEEPMAACNLWRHRGRNKMATIFHTAFWNAFSYMKIFAFRSKFHWSLFLSVQSIIFQHLFGMAPSKRQATSRTSDGLYHRSVFASFGLNELNSFYSLHRYLYMSIDPFRPTLEILYVEIYICIFIMTFYGIYLLTILYSIDVGLATWNITSTIQTAIQEVPVAPSLISLIPVISTPILHNPKLPVKKSILFILNVLQAMFLSETVLPKITNFHI